MVRQGLEKIYLHVKVDNEEGQALFERSGYEEPADAKAGLTQFQVRSIQKFFTHRSVSTFDRVGPFQLTTGVHTFRSARWNPFWPCHLISRAGIALDLDAIWCVLSHTGPHTTAFAW